MPALDDRLTLLERIAAQHDARMTRYDALHEEHAAQMARLDALHEEQARRLTRMDDQLAEQRQIHRALVAGFDRLEAVLLAIKDLLPRRNGD